VKARKELWALACALGPRARGQLRLVARQMVRRDRGAERRDQQADRRDEHNELADRQAAFLRGMRAATRRWWQICDGAEWAGLPAEVGGLPGVTVLGAEA
jgi:hypothetical protein